jgi:hypothetical protein
MHYCTGVPTYPPGGTNTGPPSELIAFWSGNAALYKIACDFIRIAVTLTQRVRRHALSELVEVGEKLADEVLAFLQDRCVLRSLLHLTLCNNYENKMLDNGNIDVSTYP